MDGECNHSMGSLMNGTPPSPKTDSDRLMKDVIGAVTVCRPLKWQKERKKGGVARN